MIQRSESPTVKRILRTAPPTVFVMALLVLQAWLRLCRRRQVDGGVGQNTILPVWAKRHSQACPIVNRGQTVWMANVRNARLVREVSAKSCERRVVWRRFHVGAAVLMMSDPPDGNFIQSARHGCRMTPSLGVKLKIPGAGRFSSRRVT